jgi:calcium-dependent protein kinase
MKKLNSPYAISYDYQFETDKAFYLKMEYFEKTLKDKITTKMLVRNQKKFMKQLLLGLEEMKSKGIIHRDLKPDNIMIRKNAKGEEECVIIDFGLATFVDAIPYLYFRCGTPGFLSPEIANLTNKKEKQLCSSDMFSLGCIFYKMYPLVSLRLTGHYLFGGKTAKEVLHHNRKCEYAATF